MGKRKNKHNAKEHNRTYYQSERLIQKAVFSLIGSFRGRLTARQVAKAAGLSRKTIYRHYSDINCVITESEQAILDEFTAEIEQQSHKLRNIIPDTNTRLFYAMLVFMAHRREIFCPICADVSNQGILYQMVELIYPELEIAWLTRGSCAPSLGSERADVLIRIMVEVLCKWSASTNCNVRRANHYIQRLLRAVLDAATNRLP